MARARTRTSTTRTSSGAQGRARQAGLTLLELLLVLVIIGVLAATVLTAFPNVAGERSVQAEAQRLALAVELARGEALRRNELWGLAVHEAGYAFHRYAEDEWEPVQRRLLEPRQTEDGIALTVHTAVPTGATEEFGDEEQWAESPDEPPPPTPDVAIHPGGETTPFSVTVAAKASADPGPVWVVRSDGFARATAQPQGEDALGAPPLRRRYR